MGLESTALPLSYIAVLNLNIRKINNYFKFELKNTQYKVTNEQPLNGDKNSSFYEVRLIYDICIA